jgi:hypothetical protein
MCKSCNTQSRDYDWRGCINCAVRVVRMAKKTHEKQRMLDFVGQWHDKAKVLSRVAGAK